MNYIVDVAIGVGLLISAVSGIVLYFAPSGFQGGRNAFYMREVLFLTTHQWSTLHTWSSFLMVAGALGHLILHWNWMVCMTRKLFGRKKAEQCPVDTV
jgi:hypothetical protein